MINIFNNIDSKNKYKLLHSFKADTHKFNQNQVITRTIFERNIIGIIIKGSVKLIRKTEQGTNYLLEKIDENNIIGEILYNINFDDYELLTNEETEIVIMNYNDLINYRGKNKYYNIFIKNLFQIINIKTKELNERIDILSRKGIRNKLLAYFDIMYKKNNSRNIYLPSTYTELADFIAVDRTAMTREIRTLKEEGFIKTTGKRITLLYK